MEQQVMETGGQQDTQTVTVGQFKGLLADKQAEVRRRQEAERINTQLQQQIEYLKSGGSAIQMELNARKAIDPHAPEPETPKTPKPAAQPSGFLTEEDENRPLTMKDLVELLGGGPDGTESQPQAAKTGGKTAGSVPGASMPWFRRQPKPLSKMSDEELQQLAQEVD
jgi:hypothetical protein